jgi:threonylcarbamoyladenosine tRNA methylthiotransferase MtaB
MTLGSPCATSCARCRTERPRLSSIDQVEADKIPWPHRRGAAMPHLHLSLQAADDIVLKRMKRRTAG